MKDGILWNTPKYRKSLEVRHRAMFGDKKWGNTRFHRVNNKIRVDHKTGEYFELGKLAPKTYEKIMKETTEIKTKICDTFGQFSPRDKETTILYEGKILFGIRYKLICNLCPPLVITNNLFHIFFILYIVLGETADKEEENRLSVKIDKERPTFFSRNLTEKTTVSSKSNTSTTIRPSGLA